MPYQAKSQSKVNLLSKQTPLERNKFQKTERKKRSINYAIINCSAHLSMKYTKDTEREKKVEELFFYFLFLFSVANSSLPGKTRSVILAGVVHVADDELGGDALVHIFVAPVDAIFDLSINQDKK